MADRDADHALAGVDLLRLVAAGKRGGSGLVHLLGFRFEAIEEGACRLSYTPVADHRNLAEAVHGGVIAALLDTAMGLAAESAMPPFRRAVTVELKIGYVRAVAPGDAPVTASARVLSAGRSIAHVDGRVEDPEGRLIAYGSSTLAVRDLTPVVG